jgi:hypothetical protein
MSCEYNKEKLEAYAAGILDGKEKRETEDHIRSCDGCRGELAGLKRAALLLEQAFDEEAPSWLTQKTLAALKAKPKRPFSWFAWGLPALAGCAAVVLLLVIVPEFKGRLGGGGNEIRVSQAEKTVKNETMAAAMDFRSAPPAPEDRVLTLPSGIADEFAINLENPINDRSIYADLGVAKKVANLLL